MNIKAKAAAITAGLIVAAIVATELIRAAVNYLTTDQLADLFGSAFGAFFVYCAYRGVLSHLEYKKALQDMQDSRVDQ